MSELLQDASMLIGKKVFIKRGEHQAKLAMVIGQVDDERYTLRINAAIPDWECEKECFIPVKRYRRAYAK